MQERKIGDLTVTEFAELLREIMEELLYELVDPDAELLLRDEFVAELQQSIDSLASGAPTGSLDEVEDELNSGTNSPSG